MAKLLKTEQKGFAALLIILLILAVVFGILTGLSLLALNQHKISVNLAASSRAYYMAEAGIEDALLRIKNRLSLSPSYQLTGPYARADIVISEGIGGSRTIVASGNSAGRVRKIQVSYAISSQHVSFYYGAQAGEGGVEMRNNSLIRGNVFTNGSIIGAPNADITDNVIVASGQLDRVRVGGNAKVDQCLNSQIAGDLFYVSGNNCSVDGQTEQITDIASEEFAISPTTVNQWQAEAEEGEIIETDYEVHGFDSLGPAHIKGDLKLNENSVLKMQGNILVSGNLRIENNAVLELDEDYYHSFSGVLIVEGLSRIRPGGVLRGSGQPGSYLMLVSLNDSLENAIQVDNTSKGGIFFAPYGAILLNQNIEIREATAYKLILQERAEILYETGLENVFFSSGIGGGWEVLSWQEIY